LEVDHEVSCRPVDVKFTQLAMGVFYLFRFCCAYLYNQYTVYRRFEVLVMSSRRSYNTDFKSETIAGNKICCDEAA
jgi:hypothetical protein